MAAYGKYLRLVEGPKWGASPTTHPVSPAKPHQSDFGSLRQRKHIINIDAQVPYRVLDFAVAKQNLDRSEIAVEANGCRIPLTAVQWPSPTHRPSAHTVGCSDARQDLRGWERQSRQWCRPVVPAKQAD
jgi:hypothetical protein